MAHRARQPRRVRRVRVGRQRDRSMDARAVPRYRPCGHDERGLHSARQPRLPRGRLRLARVRRRPDRGEDGRDGHPRDTRRADPDALPRRRRSVYRARMTKQAFPSSITTADALLHPGSVLDHKFGTGDPYTLGVEEEYMLLDSESFDLVQHIDTVLADLLGHEHEDRVKT